MDALLDNRKRDEPRSRVQISMPPRLRKHLWRPEGSGQHSSPMPPRVAKLQTPEARGGAEAAQPASMRRISATHRARVPVAPPPMRRDIDRIILSAFQAARLTMRAVMLSGSELLNEVSTLLRQLQHRLQELISQRDRNRASTPSNSHRSGA